MPLSFEQADSRLPIVRPPKPWLIKPKVVRLLVLSESLTFRSLSGDSNPLIGENSRFQVTEIQFRLASGEKKTSFVTEDTTDKLCL